MADSQTPIPQSPNNSEPTSSNISSDAQPIVPNVPTMAAMPSIHVPNLNTESETTPTQATQPTQPPQSAQSSQSMPAQAMPPSQTNPSAQSVPPEQPQYASPVPQTDIPQTGAAQPSVPQYGTPQFGTPQQPSAPQPQFGAYAPQQPMPTVPTGQTAPSGQANPAQPQPNPYGDPVTPPQYGAPAGAPMYGAYGQPMNQGFPTAPGAPMPQYATQPGSGDTSIEPPIWHPWYGISFPGAITRFFKKYATFNGRASRSEYWWVVLFLALVQIVFAILESATNGSSAVNLIAGLWSLAILVPQLALSVRRLHDANLSGWWIIVPYILAVTGTILMFVGGMGAVLSIASDTTGATAGLGAAMIGVLMALVGGIMSIVFTLLPSKPEGARFDKPTL